MIGSKYLVPYYRLFPIWRYGERSNIWGEPIEPGWWPDPFGHWEFATEAEAHAHIAQMAASTRTDT